MRMTDLKEEKVVRGYNGYLLPDNERSKLLAKFPPKYKDVIAHHITVKYPALSSDPLPEGTSFKVVGYADDGLGLEALVIEVNGSVYRPDGKIFHITWSLSEGRKPVESNKVISEKGYEKVDPINIHMIPTFFRG